jgi:anti-sigma regulatory factor (Ser/Thr protein kinase)
MRTRFAGDPEAPSAARSYVARQLGEGAVPPGLQLDDVVLVASELVTNAVRAGADWVQLTLRTSRRRLDLVIEDDAPGLPVLASADDEAVSGRGLGIVDQLTDAWAVTPRATGKTVTATWLDPRSGTRR